MEENQQSQQYQGNHARDLSILEEGDEEDEDLPVRPWERHSDGKKNPVLHDGMSKEEFLRHRAQGGNILFSGKHQTFKFRAEDGDGYTKS